MPGGRFRLLLSWPTDSVDGGVMAPEGPADPPESGTWRSFDRVLPAPGAVEALDE